jgi:RNA polymerase sigma factor (sigma-70 family)
LDHAALPDEDLFERWRTARDAGAFAEVERRYRNEMLGYARGRLRRMGVPGAAERAQDAVQETFLRLTLRTTPLPHVRSWLYCVLGNLVTDEGRERKRAVRLVSVHSSREEDILGVEPAEEDLGPLQELINAEAPGDIVKFWQCVQALADDAWRLLVMHYVDERSYQGIVRLTGLKYSQVCLRLHEARQQLRKCYQCRLSGLE